MRNRPRRDSERLRKDVLAEVIMQGAGGRDTVDCHLVAAAHHELSPESAGQFMRHLAADGYLTKVREPSKSGHIKAGYVVTDAGLDFASQPEFQL